VLAHYEAMLLHYGVAVGMRIARKHLGWYSKGLPGSAEFRAAVNRSENVGEVTSMIRGFFEPLIERAAA
jgi:tRNA-dihydrouridine synthase B